MLPLSDKSYQFPSVFPGIWTPPQPPAAKKPIADKPKVKSKLSVSSAAFVPISEASPSAGPLSAPPFAAPSAPPAAQAYPSAPPFAGHTVSRAPQEILSRYAGISPTARPGGIPRGGAAARRGGRGAGDVRSGPRVSPGLEDSHTIAVPKPSAKERMLKLPGWAEAVSLIEAGRGYSLVDPTPSRTPYPVVKVETLSEALARKKIEPKSFLGFNQMLEKHFPKEIADGNKITFTDGPSTEEDSALTDEAFEVAIAKKSSQIPTVADLFEALSLEARYPQVSRESTERKKSKNSKALDFDQLDDDESDNDDELVREVLHITSQQELHAGVMEDILKSWANLTRPLRKAWHEFLENKPAISAENFDPCFELEEHQKIWDAYIAFENFVYPGDFSEGTTTLPSNLNPFSYKIIDTSKPKPTIKEIRERE
jgi:hypothetical protein